MRTLPMVFVAALMACVFHTAQAAEGRRDGIQSKIVKPIAAEAALVRRDKIGQLQAANRKKHGEQKEQHPERDERPERPGRRSHRIVTVGDEK